MSNSQYNSHNKKFPRTFRVRNLKFLEYAVEPISTGTVPTRYTAVSQQGSFRWAHHPSRQCRDWVLLIPHSFIRTAKQKRWIPIENIPRSQSLLNINIIFWHITSEQIFSLSLNVVWDILSPWCVKLYTFNSQYNKPQIQPVSCITIIFHILFYTSYKMKMDSNYF